MLTKNAKAWSGYLVAGSLALFVSPSLPQATSPGVTQPDARLSPAEVAQFRATPDSLLTANPSAGLPLAATARGLLVSDPTLIDSLIAVAAKGNPDQQSAIGTGLAQGARFIARTSPQSATTIQQKIAKSGLSQLIAAFITGSNQVETAAVGGGGAGAGGGGGAGGGAGGGGGVGGPTGGVLTSGGSNAGSNPGATSDSTANGFTGNSIAGSAGSVSTSGGTTVITNNSVSPSI